MKREDTIDYHIKATWHAIARMYNAEANQYELTVSVGYILLNIDLEKGTPATKIAPLLGLEARSITRTLKNMEEAGFIYKVQDDKDRRFFRIFLTEKGKIAREHSRQTQTQDCDPWVVEEPSGVGVTPRHFRFSKHPAAHANGESSVSGRPQSLNIQPSDPPPQPTPDSH